MAATTGYIFMPTDQELLVHYLAHKTKSEALPCAAAIIEREIYGAGDKAPWQIFTDQDPWVTRKTKNKNKKGSIFKTESTIYVFNTLIEAGKNRMTRRAGCGSWTVLDQQAVKKDDSVIGYKRTLCFQITSEQGTMEENAKKGRWIMHEYSLCGGNTNTSNGKGEYVLCKIKRDDEKFTLVTELVEEKKMVQEQSFQESRLGELDEVFADLGELVTVVKQEGSFPGPCFTSLISN